MQIFIFAYIFLDDIDLELRLARFEELIARRPLLLNSVLLRQNPHNVHEWHKRVKLYDGNPRQVSYFKEVQIVIIKLLFLYKRVSTLQSRSSTHTLRQYRLWIQSRPLESLTLSGFPLLNFMKKMTSLMM